MPGLKDEVPEHDGWCLAYLRDFITETGKAVSWRPHIPMGLLRMSACIGLPGQVTLTGGIIEGPFLECMDNGPVCLVLPYLTRCGTGARNFCST